MNDLRYLMRSDLRVFEKHEELRRESRARRKGAQGCDKFRRFDRIRC